MTRRRAGALKVLAVAAVVATLLAPSAPAVAASDDAGQLTTTTPIKHFMVLMQANHSFDNYFGTYPGADGIPAGTCVPVDPKVPGNSCVEPFHLDGQGIAPMGQSPQLHAAQYNGGAMNGFVSAFQHWPAVGNQPMGYYDDSDIPYYWNVADNYVLFDRLFTSAAGSSVWNHMFWTTGTPGNPSADALSPSGFDAVPTIFDRLQAAGISWKFYVQNYKQDITMRTPGSGHETGQLVRVPLLNYNRFLDDPALHSRIVDMSEYYEDLQDGTLPAVSFMSPAGASEHPPSSVNTGARFVNSLVDALMTSSSWKSSAFMWTYDDSGGWYDHVTPPPVDQYGYGFRSPALLVSPYAKKGHVDHTTLDFTSELKFIENNWQVAPLATRDAAANDITTAFDFSAPPRAATLLGTSRDVVQTPTHATTVVYLCYGLALLMLSGLVAIWLWRHRRLPRRELA
jgi:phospholipase C